MVQNVAKWSVNKGLDLWSIFSSIINLFSNVFLGKFFVVVLFGKIGNVVIWQIEFPPKCFGPLFLEFCSGLCKDI